MKRLITFFTVSILLSTTYTYGQLLDGINVELTKADTLRGALRPERTCFDVHYYDLNLDVTDIEGKTIAGWNEIHYNVVEDFETLQIDLFDNMEIESIIYNDKNLEYTREYNAVFVHFGEIQKKGTQGSIVVNYGGQPTIADNPPWDGGFTWQEDSNGNPWIGVSCEGIGASLWWPNKDHLSDEPDSMRVTCTVPSDLVFVGNGVLEYSGNLMKASGEVNTSTWKVSYPINNYNITLNIGNYTNFQDEYTAADGEKLILDYWVLPENLEKAKKQFQQVQPMLACFEQYFGKFPFWEDNYKLVETPYLGMEHQTAIAYGNEYKTGYAGWDISRIGLDFDYIIIHETGHEYWGNSIGCRDMADLWIHEGFCTYSEALYVECMFDYELAQDYVNAKKPTIGNEYPMLGIYDVNVEGDGDMYNKGMLFLNTLRHVVNDDELWFEILMEMNQKFQYQTITTNDIILFFNKKTGMNLTSIFMQYLNYPDIPSLYYSIEKEGKKNYTLKYKWMTDVQDFEMPVVLNVGNEEIRLDGTTNLQYIEFTKSKKEKWNFDQRHFYYKLKEMSK